MTRYVILLLSIMLLFGCEKKSDPCFRTNVRPEDFPSFLKTPQNAKGIEYSTPESEYMNDGTYCISYLIEETFPPDKIMAFISNELSFAEFFQLKYALNRMWMPNKLREPGYIHLEWMDILGKKGNLDKITVALQYRHKVENKDPSVLEVSIIYVTDSSYMKKYKELHPEEFS